MTAGTELELATPAQAVAPLNLFGTTSPSEVVARAASCADALADVIRSKHLYTTIGGRNHVLVEGWTLLGSMLGVFPVCVWTHPIETEGVIMGWEARVEARTLAGQVVGAAEAECLRSESNWRNRDDYALRSMAQTRATSKAMRLPLGFVVVLAGYEATPAEEIAAAPAKRGSKPRQEATRTDVREADSSEGSSPQSPGLTEHEVSF